MKGKGKGPMMVLQLRTLKQGREEKEGKCLGCGQIPT